MSMCIKTGCDVFVEELGAKVRADLHKMYSQNGDIIIIVNYNTRSAEFRHDSDDSNVGVRISDGFHHDLTGLIVAPIENFDSRIFNYVTRTFKKG